MKKYTSGILFFGCFTWNYTVPTPLDINTDSPYHERIIFCFNQCLKSKVFWSSVWSSNSYNLSHCLNQTSSNLHWNSHLLLSLLIVSLWGWEIWYYSLSSQCYKIDWLKQEMSSQLWFLFSSKTKLASLGDLADALSCRRAASPSTIIKFLIMKLKNYFKCVIN